MAKRPTLTSIGTGYASATTLDANFDAIKSAFDNTLSRDGSTPNTMSADFDMNNNDILNAGVVNTSTLKLSGTTVSTNALVTSAVQFKQEFDTVADLLADTNTYTNYAAGDYLRVLDGNFVYKVAASGATDEHVTNAGGVKLYVKPGTLGYNVKAFNAKGDDSTDDTAAIQAAFDAAQLVEGGVFVPVGVHRHTGLTLDPDKSCNVIGEAYNKDGAGGAELKNIDVAGSHAITIDNTPFTGNYDKQIRFSNLTVSGNASSGDGFNVDQCMVFLENVWINGHGGHGYWAQRCYSSAFRQVAFVDNSKSGFNATRALNAVHFDHCLFNGNALLTSYAGCHLTGASGADRNFGVVFTACDFTGNGATLTGGDVAYGLVLQHTAGATLNGCYFENNCTWNVYVDSTSSNVTMTGCFLQDAPNFLVDVDGLIFENNHVYDSGGATTTLQMDFGMPNDRFPNRIRSTQFTGSVTKTFSGGVYEAQEFWFTSAPTGGTWFRGDVVWNQNANGGDTLGWICTVAGTPGTWLPINQIPQTFANHGDAAATLTPLASFPTNIWASPITADRTVTLSTTNAFSGCKFRIVRKAGATGAFNVNVGSGPLKALSAGEWCDVEYDGSAWVLTAFGTL